MKRTLIFSFLCTLIIGAGIFTLSSFTIHHVHADDTTGTDQGDADVNGNPINPATPSDTSNNTPSSPGDYQLLVPLPLGPNGATISSIPTVSQKNTALGTYVKGLYVLFIALSAVIAVVMIVYGGILYMSTDAIFNKSQGKAIIIRTLWGLLLIMGSYVILNTINPSLVSFSGGSTESSTAPVAAPGNWCYKIYVNDTNNYLTHICFQNNKSTCSQQSTNTNGNKNGLTFTATCSNTPATGAWNTIQTCISVVAHSTLGGSSVTMTDVYNGQPCFGNTYQGTDNSNYTAYINKLQCYQASATCYGTSPGNTTGHAANGDSCYNKNCPFSGGTTPAPGGLNGVIDNGNGTGSFDIFVNGADDKVAPAYTTNTSVTSACASKVSYWQSSSATGQYVAQACYNQSATN